MRGKEISVGGDNGMKRITPAYAGKRDGGLAVIGSHEDHPRVCGEKTMPEVIGNGHIGSPPRMRGKVRQTYTKVISYRITPAYAGKSQSPWCLCRSCWDHPRVCGEKRQSQQSGAAMRGSPPRMRGKVSVCKLPCCNQGITPAYAGKSEDKHRERGKKRDHPRVCGEKCQYQQFSTPQ